MSTAIAPANQGQQTAIAKADDKTVMTIPALRTLVGSKIDIIRDALPEKMKGAAPRFAISLITACQASQDLAECTALSLFGGIVRAANLGLELGGECWLIPRKTKDVAPRGQAPGPDYFVANFQVGWKGVVTLLYRNPRVLRVAADVVRHGDDFQLINGTESRIVHSYGKTRGMPTAYYAVIKLRGGESINCVMSVAEVEDHRKRFASATSKAWRESFDSMALKTVVIKASKTSPRAVELPDAADQDEVQVDGVDLLPAGAVQPRPGEAVTLERLDYIIGAVAKAEGSDSGSIVSDVCAKFKVATLEELTVEQMTQVFGELQTQLEAAVAAGK